MRVPFEAAAAAEVIPPPPFHDPLLRPATMSACKAAAVMPPAAIVTSPAPEVEVTAARLIHVKSAEHHSHTATFGQ